MPKVPAIPSPIQSDGSNNKKSRRTGALSADHLNAIEEMSSKENLQFVTVEDWVMIFRLHFDFFDPITHEPHFAISALFNVATGKFIHRAWGQTLTSKFASSVKDLKSSLAKVFHDMIPCPGLFEVMGQVEGEEVRSDFPFKRQISKNCKLTFPASRKKPSNICSACKIDLSKTSDPFGNLEGVVQAKEKKFVSVSDGTQDTESFNGSSEEVGFKTEAMKKTCEKDLPEDLNLFGNLEKVVDTKRRKREGRTKYGIESSSTLNTESDSDPGAKVSEEIVALKKEEDSKSNYKDIFKEIFMVLARANTTSEGN